MPDESIISDNDGKPTHIRVTSDDKTKSTVHEYDHGFLNDIFGTNKGKPVQEDRHFPDGTTEAYKHDSGFLAGLFDGNRGAKISGARDEGSSNERNTDHSSSASYDGDDSYSGPSSSSSSGSGIYILLAVCLAVIAVIAIPKSKEDSRETRYNPLSGCGPSVQVLSNNQGADNASHTWGRTGTTAGINAGTPKFHSDRFRLKATHDGLNIRAEASAASNIIGNLPMGSENIEISGDAKYNGDTLWVKIDVGEYGGWVAADFLAPQGKSAEMKIKNAATAAAKIEKNSRDAEDGLKAVDYSDNVLTQVEGFVLQNASRTTMEFQLLTPDGWKNAKLEAGASKLYVGGFRHEIRWRENGNYIRGEMTRYGLPYYSGRNYDLHNMAQMAPVNRFTRTLSGRVSLDWIESQ